MVKYYNCDILLTRSNKVWSADHITGLKGKIGRDLKFSWHNNMIPWYDSGKSFSVLLIWSIVIYIATVLSFFLYLVYEFVDSNIESDHTYRVLQQLSKGRLSKYTFFQVDVCPRDRFQSRRLSMVTFVQGVKLRKCRLLTLFFLHYKTHLFSKSQ